MEVGLGRSQVFPSPLLASVSVEVPVLNMMWFFTNPVPQTVQVGWKITVMILGYEGRNCIRYQREVHQMSGKTRTRTQSYVVLFGKLCSFQCILMLIFGDARDRKVL